MTGLEQTSWNRFQPETRPDLQMARQLLIKFLDVKLNAMLRVTIVESSRTAVALRVEGRITGPWVEELRRACETHALFDEIHLSLDLADIAFADAAGIALLRELQVRGVDLRRATPFIAEELKDQTSGDETEQP